jgi:DNA modification methylase
MRVELLHGDCVDLMRAMPECSVDSIVTDPPYELSFMGKTWDGAGIAYSLDMWREALRVLKPGGHLLAFGGTRTYHRMACAIEDAGFEIRDSIHWVYGSGFPKSLDVSKAIDKAAGAEREVVGVRRGAINPNGYKADSDASSGGPYQPVYETTTAATDEAARWEGWGTALKPAHEPIVVARKPLQGTVAGNVLVWGTGGLNIDGCRVGAEGATRRASNPKHLGRSDMADFTRGNFGVESVPSGRWPANIVLDGAAAAALDQQSGVSVSDTGRQAGWQDKYVGGTYTPISRTGYDDRGGASRFFTQADFGPDDWPFVYQAKPSKRERNAGLDKPSTHPTVKPVALMRHLVRLVTPPGGTVLDPFAGSGTTLVAAVLEGMNAIGCEMTDEYLPIIRGRVAWAEQQADAEQPRLL